MPVHQEEKSTTVEVNLGYGPPEKGPDLDAWREQVNLAKRASEKAYAGFLDSLFFYYRETVRVTQREVLGEKAWQ